MVSYPHMKTPFLAGFNIYKSLPKLQDTDFVVGVDSFEDVQINGTVSSDHF